MRFDMSASTMRHARDERGRYARHASLFRFTDAPPTPLPELRAQSPSFFADGAKRYYAFFYDTPPRAYAAVAIPRYFGARVPLVAAYALTVLRFVARGAFDAPGASTSRGLRPRQASGVYAAVAERRAVTAMLLSRARVFRRVRRAQAKRRASDR